MKLILVTSIFKYILLKTLRLVFCRQSLNRQTFTWIWLLNSEIVSFCFCIEILISQKLLERALNIDFSDFLRLFWSKLPFGFLLSGSLFIIVTRKIFVFCYWKSQRCLKKLEPVKIFSRSSSSVSFKTTVSSFQYDTPIWICWRCLKTVKLGFAPYRETLFIEWAKKSIISGFSRKSN